jgi:hypothetical protein
MFSHIEYGSNHGMTQGIVPRFYLQVLDLAQLVIGEKEFEKKYDVFEKTVMPELQNLYNIYHEIIELIDDYKEGMSNGKYYKLSSQGTPMIDRGNEEKIKNLVKDYIIRNKVLLVNFSQCGLMNDDGFDFNQFTVFNDKREKRKQDYLARPDYKFAPLIDLVEKANELFIKDLFGLRNSFEHQAFYLDKFNLKPLKGAAEVHEPQLAGRMLSDKLSFYYEGTLDYIERIMVYYFGILGEEKMKGFLQLYEDPVFNYATMNYKFRFSMGGTPWSFTSKRCTYE